MWPLETAVQRRTALHSSVSSELTAKEWRDSLDGCSSLLGTSVSSTPLATGDLGSRSFTFTRLVVAPRKHWCAVWSAVHHTTVHTD